MATNFLELATILTNLGAKWLPEKKLILRPVTEKFSWMTTYMYYPSRYFPRTDTMRPLQMNIIASHDQFTPIRIRENLVVNYMYICDSG